VDSCWSCRKCVCEHCEHVWIADLCSVKLFPNLEAALKGVFNRVLTTLYLGANNIGVEGAKAIADALKVTAVLNFFPNASANPNAQGGRAKVLAIVFLPFSESEPFPDIRAQQRSRMLSAALSKIELNAEGVLRAAGKP